MLPREKRLRTKDLQDLFARGSFFSYGGLSLKYRQRENSPQGLTRIACIAPKKHFRHAVERNSMRRLLYRSIAAFYADIASGYDIALIASGKVSSEDVPQKVRELFARAHLLKTSTNDSL